MALYANIPNFWKEKNIFSGKKKVIKGKSFHPFKFFLSKYSAFKILKIVLIFRANLTLKHVGNFFLMEPWQPTGALISKGMFLSFILLSYPKFSKVIPLIVFAAPRKHI